MRIVFVRIVCRFFAYLTTRLHEKDACPRLRQAIRDHTAGKSCADWKGKLCVNYCPQELITVFFLLLPTIKSKVSPSSKMTLSNILSILRHILSCIGTVFMIVIRSGTQIAVNNKLPPSGEGVDRIWRGSLILPQECLEDYHVLTKLLIAFDKHRHWHSKNLRLVLLHSYF